METKELIFQGAEAKLFKTKLEEETALLKERTPKKYRNSELDKKIRRERTTLEANLLTRVKSLGVNVPAVLQIDRENSKLYMEFIEGKRVKNILNKKNFSWICREIGKTIAKIHSANIIHGDITTSNIMQKPFLGKKSLGKRKIKEKGRELFFIDFGLGFHSKKIEDKAVDLIVFKKTFEATHFPLMPKAWQTILKAYEKENPEQAKLVFAQMEKVEKRGRYH